MAEPVSTERRARVWLWLAHQALGERDDGCYAYPRPDGWEVEYDRLGAIAEACVARAEAVLPGCSRGPVWVWALDSFGSADDVPLPVAGAGP